MQVFECGEGRYVRGSNDERSAGATNVNKFSDRQRNTNIPFDSSRLKIGIDGDKDHGVRRAEWRLEDARYGRVVEIGSSI